jgi:putative sigma-54 modulation protein
MVIQTQSLHFDADTKLLSFVDRKVGKLDTFFDRILHADVVLRLEKTGQVQDKIAEIKLNLPGTVLMAKQTCKSFEEAVGLASESLRRQLVRHKGKNRIAALPAAIGTPPSFST